MRRLPGVVVLGGLLAAAPLYAQGTSWQNMWFWGAQVGVSAYKTPTTNGGTQMAIAGGGHWLITGKRMGLYLSYEQLYYPNGPSTAPGNPTSQIIDPTSGTGVRDVQFDQGRYIQGDLLAIPMNGPLQIYLGAGFTIQNITDAVPMGSFATPDDQAYSQSLVDDAASRAFVNFMGGFQLLLQGRLAVFGSYEFIPSARNFLLTSQQHVFMGGVRIALSGRREDVGIQR
jgi:hypothetical protein